MSIAGMTSTLYMVRPRRHSAGSSAVVRELQWDWDVLRFAQRLDHELQGVFVLADHAQLVALDPHLDLGCGVLDLLSEVASDVVGDARIQLDLDLAATLAHRLRLPGLEQLWRQLAASRLLTEDLERGLGALLARRVDQDLLVGLVVNRGRVFEVVARADLPACLVQGVGQLG